MNTQLNIPSCSKKYIHQDDRLKGGDREGAAHELLSKTDIKRVGVHSQQIPRHAKDYFFNHDLI